MKQNAEILEWLRLFEKYVREKEFDKAKAMYKKSSDLFGTRVTYSSDIEEYQQLQWSKIWNVSEHFTIDKLIKTGVGDPYSFAVALWRNTTVVDQKKIERSGRATFVFEAEEGKLRAIHSHFSDSPRDPA